MIANGLSGHCFGLTATIQGGKTPLVLTSAAIDPRPGCGGLFPDAI